MARRQGDDWQTLAAVEDISVDRGTVAELTARCRRLGLSPVHLMDVVEDLLACGKEDTG